LERTLNGLDQRLYRVREEFRNEFDIHDCPFDEQSLPLRLQRPRYPFKQVVCVVDSLGLRPAQAAASWARPFASLESWKPRGIRHFQQTLMITSTRSDSAAFDTFRETLVSVLQAAAVMQRLTSVLLLKSLLPLMLLVSVVFVTLYFPFPLLKERLAIGISCMLADAVLLGSVTNRVAEAGYATAIEYAFHVFFSLCLSCITAALLIERLKFNHKDWPPRYWSRRRRCAG